MLFLILLLLSGSTAQAACNNLKIQDLDDVDFTSNPSPTESFTVKRAGSGGCTFFVTIDNGAASSYSSRRLSYSSNTIPAQVCADTGCAGIVKNFPEISSSTEILIGTFPEGNNEPKELTLSFYPRLGNLDYQYFGDYEDQFTMRVFEGVWSGVYSQHDSDIFKLKHRVPKKIDLSIVNTGGSFDQNSTAKTLNFGALSAGQQLTFDLIVKFNAGYRVRLSSQNNGALKHQSFSDTIPYNLGLNGNPVSLAGSSSSPVIVSQGSGVSAAGGLRFAGSATIGALGTPRTGTYQDAITVTVSTTE